MTQKNLCVRVVQPDSPEWQIAVHNKRERAYGVLEGQGAFSRQEIEERYQRYKETKGVAFHDERLRQEVGEGQLLTWWRGEMMVAYAPVSAQGLLGGDSPIGFYVEDVWVDASTSQEEREQIVQDLLDQARAAYALVMRLNCDDLLADASRQSGGQPMLHTFDFKLS
jgi:hypothetical protein